MHQFFFSPLTYAKLLVASFLFTVPCSLRLLPVKGKIYLTEKKTYENARY